MQHWKQHKPNCTWIKEHYVKCKEDMSKVLPDSSALDSKEGPCAICLEETITNPVILPCGHAFAFHVSEIISNHLHLRKARRVHIAGGRFQKLLIKLWIDQYLIWSSSSCVIKRIRGSKEICKAFSC